MKILKANHRYINRHIKNPSRLKKSPYINEIWPDRDIEVSDSLFREFVDVTVERNNDK